MPRKEISYNNIVQKDLEPTRYTLAYENGELIRRGQKRVRGHVVTLYNNYTRLPKEIRADVATRLLVEVAIATHSDPESVRKLLLDNYIRSSNAMFQNAERGVYDDVAVEPITYTIDPRRRPIRILEAPIVDSQN